MAPTDVHSDDTLHIAAMQQPHPSVVAVAMTTDDVTGHVSFSSFVGPRFRVALMARQEADALIRSVTCTKVFSHYSQYYYYYYYCYYHFVPLADN